MSLDESNILSELPDRMKTDNVEILQQLVADFRGRPRCTSRKERQIAVCALTKESEKVLDGFANKCGWIC